MNKVLTLTSIVILAVAAFFFLRKPVVAPAMPDAETPTGTVTPAPQEPAPTSPSEQPTVESTYSYTNNEFKFAVALPGLVMTEKKSIDRDYKPTIFTFGVGDQTEVPADKKVSNTMAVYIWHNPAEFQLLMSQKSTIATETVNGHTYDVYSITEGPRISYRYATTLNGKTYDVGIWNRTDIKKFFLLD